MPLGEWNGWSGAPRVTDRGSREDKGIPRKDDSASFQNILADHRSKHIILVIVTSVVSNFALVDSLNEVKQGHCLLLPETLKMAFFQDIYTSISIKVHTLVIINVSVSNKLTTSEVIFCRYISTNKYLFCKYPSNFFPSNFEQD